MRYLALLLLPVFFAAFKLYKTSPVAPTECTAEATTAVEEILIQSTDGGVNWQDISAAAPQEEDLDITTMEVHGDELYLGTETGHVFHSADPKTGAWKQDMIGNFFADAGGVISGKRITGIFSIASDLYACLYENGLFRKDANTGQWLPMMQSLKSDLVFDVVKAADGALFAATPTGIYKSGDDGKSWKQVKEIGWTHDLGVAGTLLFASCSEGLLRSTDGGAQWNFIISAKRTSYSIAPIDAGIALMRAGWVKGIEADVSPLQISPDGGNTWQRMDEGLNNTEVIYCLKQVGNTLLCSHSGGISRSTDGGFNWELVRPIKSTEENPARYELAVSGRRIYAYVRRGGC